MNAQIMQSGRQIDPRAPRPNMVWMGDVAAHLAKICILNGAPGCFCSEAQHAVHVADEMAKVTGALGGIYGLLHDAHLVVKTEDDAQRQSVMAAICEALDIDWPIPAPINRALLQIHSRVLLAEIRQLTPGWESIARTMEREGILEARISIRALSWDRAMDRFNERLRGYAVAANLRPVAALEGIL